MLTLEGTTKQTRCLARVPTGTPYSWRHSQGSACVSVKLGKVWTAVRRGYAPDLLLGRCLPRCAHPTKVQEPPMGPSRVVPHVSLVLLALLLLLPQILLLVLLGDRVRLGPDERSVLDPQQAVRPALLGLPVGRCEERAKMGEDELPVSPRVVVL